jgi:hypothetical protein
VHSMTVSIAALGLNAGLERGAAAQQSRGWSTAHRRRTISAAAAVAENPGSRKCGYLWLASRVAAEQAFCDWYGRRILAAVLLIASHPNPWCSVSKVASRLQGMLRAANWRTLRGLTRLMSSGGRSHGVLRSLIAAHLINP